MDSKKYMFLINGQDKTDSVASFRFQDGMCEVVYSSSPKPYRYQAQKVKLLKVQSRVDPSEFIITVDGNHFSQVDEILDFGPFYRFLREGKKLLHTPKAKWNFRRTALQTRNRRAFLSILKKRHRRSVWLPKVVSIS